MEQSRAIKDEWPLKSPADDVHAIYRRACYLFPKITNSGIQKVEFVSGDSWASPGLQRRWTFDKGNCGTCVDTVEHIDDQTRSITFTLVHGEVLNKLYNSLKLVYHFNDNEGGCIAKVALKFDKKNINADPSDYLTFVGNTLKAVDDYLQGTYNQA